MKKEEGGEEYMKPIYAVLVAVVVGAVGFFGGMQYQKSQGNSPFGAGGPMRFQNGQGQFFTRNGGARSAGRVVGSILNMDATSMTVKSPDGSTKIVVLSGSTTYNKAEAGSLSDLKVGDNVAVFGSSNADGSVTAQNVQIGQFRMQGGGNTPNGSQSGSPRQ